MQDIKVGDWIRFQQNGRLVIDEVAYRGSDTFGHPVYVTQQHMPVPPGSVLEVRRKNAEDQ